MGVLEFYEEAYFYNRRLTLTFKGMETRSLNILVCNFELLVDTNCCIVARLSVFHVDTHLHRLQFNELFRPISYKTLQFPTQ
jgi:hypothetical protein